MTLHETPRIRTPGIHAAALAFALLACACSRQAGTQDAASAPAAPATPATPATPAAPATPASQATVAGTYTGTLPCADCPGIDETLVLSADATFVQTDVYRERPDGTNVTRGSWALEAGGTRIRLSPDGDDTVDRLYGIDGDGLRMLDPEGNPIDSPLPYRLERND